MIPPDYLSPSVFSYVFAAYFCFLASRLKPKPLFLLSSTSILYDTPTLSVSNEQNLARADPHSQLHIEYCMNLRMGVYSCVIAMQCSHSICGKAMMAHRACFKSWQICACAGDVTKVKITRMLQNRKG